MDHRRTFRRRLNTLRNWVQQHPRLVVRGGLAMGVVIAVGLAVAGYALTRPGARFGRQDGTWHRVQVNGDLYVGVIPTYERFAEWTPERPVGLEADIALEIGRRLGVETSLLIYSDDSLYDALYKGETDFVLSGLQVDPARADWVHFSRPYFDAGPILVSRAEAPVMSMRALDGGTVAVELASSGHVAAEQQWQRRLKSLDIRPYMLPEDAMQAVLAGEVDAALVDGVQARLFVADHVELVMGDEAVVAEEYVIALREADFRLVEEVERALDEMHADGTLDEIIDRWL
ncbi:MAG: amino acid ABC transporter substrate-binding protein [Chloroflexi bacterium]|nr:amino acid ABC transporter substrate-binding protein [Chloroflexota bacterium]